MHKYTSILLGDLSNNQQSQKKGHIQTNRETSKLRTTHKSLKNYPEKPQIRQTTHGVQVYIAKLKIML